MVRNNRFSVLFMIIFVLSLFANPAIAQDQSYSQPKAFDTNYILTGAFLGATTYFDVKHAVDFLDNCQPGAVCKLKAPLIHPFIDLNRRQAIVTETVLSAGIGGLGYWMKSRSNKYWTIPMLVAGGIHIVSSQRKIEVSYQMR